MIRVSLGKSLGDLNIAEVAAKLGALSRGEHSSITLNLSRMGYISPAGMALIRAAIASAVRSGMDPASIVIESPADREVTTYLGRMDCFPSGVAFPAYCGNRHDPRGFLPVTEFEQADIEHMGVKLATQGGAELSSEARDMINDVAVETGDNAVLHANSWGGVACAQRWRSGKTEFAIIDAGRGIVSSFRERSVADGVSDRDLMMSLGRRNFTSSDEEGRGLGLNRISRYADIAGGTLLIVSREWLYRRSRGKTTVSHLGALHWPGTIVVWQVPNERGVQKAYREISEEVSPA